MIASLHTTPTGSFPFRSGRAGKIELWRDNGDGTCTRLADGLTLTTGQYGVNIAPKALPPRLARRAR